MAITKGAGGHPRSERGDGRATCDTPASGVQCGAWCCVWPGVRPERTRNVSHGTAAPHRTSTHPPLPPSCSAPQLSTNKGIHQPSALGGVMRCCCRSPARLPHPRTLRGDVRTGARGPALETLSAQRPAHAGATRGRGTLVQSRRRVEKESTLGNPPQAPAQRDKPPADSPPRHHRTAQCSSAQGCGLGTPVPAMHLTATEMGHRHSNA